MIILILLLILFTKRKILLIIVSIMDTLEGEARTMDLSLLHIVKLCQNFVIGQLINKVIRPNYLHLLPYLDIR